MVRVPPEFFSGWEGPVSPTKSSCIRIQYHCGHPALLLCYESVKMLLSSDFIFSS
jgi:hypothetical protein